MFFLYCNMESSTPHLKCVYIHVHKWTVVCVREGQQIMKNNINPGCVIVYNMNTASGTLQVTMIITILHLGLQVHCSLSFKKHFHNPTTPLLACIMKWEKPILHKVTAWCMNSVCAYTKIYYQSIISHIMHVNLMLA